MGQDVRTMKAPEGLHIPWWNIIAGRAGCIEDGLMTSREELDLLRNNESLIEDRLLGMERLFL